MPLECAAGKKVDVCAFQLSGRGTGENEFLATHLDGIVYLVEQVRETLDFIDKDPFSFRLGSEFMAE
jgi:hypothetical protein